MMMMERVQIDPSNVQCLTYCLHDCRCIHWKPIAQPDADAFNLDNQTILIVVGSRFERQFG